MLTTITPALPRDDDEAPVDITIRPNAAGWTLRLEAVGLDQAFASGAAAEAAGKAWVRALHQAGRKAVLTIYLRDGTLAGRATTASV